MVEPRIVCRVDHPGFPDWKLPFYPRSTGINVFRGRGLAESLLCVPILLLRIRANGSTHVRLCRKIRLHDGNIEYMRNS